MLTTPNRLGLACWSKERIPKVISIVAQMDRDSAHYFLCTHSPIERIRDDRSRAPISEREVFDRLIDPSRSNVLMVVHGEPGTGKSHLIRWLNLQYELEQQRGHLKGSLPILIQRRTGSLRDALLQLISQLPAEFSHHLTQVNDAIGRLSEDTAREYLVSMLHLELTTRWAERAHSSPITPALRDIGELCLAPDTRRWLCKGGGVVDRTIRQLTEQSDVMERQSLPQFVSSDFEIDPLYRNNVTPAVGHLVDEFEWDGSLKEKAAKYFNEALPLAVREMSGLAGARLRDVFDNVRRDLKRQNRSLALFIEDVSVLASLDEDIINAVEPDARAELCSLVAVVGMTEVGFRRMRDNQYDRATDLVAIDAESIAYWRKDATQVARFAARYLNAVRLDESELRRLADQRRLGDDVTVSACTSCPVRVECHNTFGAVSFDDDTSVGLFPFSPLAPSRLLESLNEDTKGVRRNQRGLLEHVLRPLLGQTDQLAAGNFPKATLPTELAEPHLWAQFTRKYCGRWPAEDTQRLKFLAQAWVSAKTVSELAAALSPYLRPLGFSRTFTADVVTEPKSDSTKVIPADTGGTTTKTEPPGITEELQRLLDSLAQWIEGRRLDADETARDLVFRLVRDSIPWNDEAIPLDEVKRLLYDKRCIRFEDQRAKPLGSFFIELPRDHKTADLVQALGRFRYEGNNSWTFVGGEVHKRVVASWLRTHRNRIVQSLRPNPPLTPEVPLAFAIRVLAIASVVRRGMDLPPDSAALISEVLGDTDAQWPPPLSSSDEALFTQLRDTIEAVRSFVQGELNVPQGDSLKRIFIEPILILDHARTAVHEATAPALSPDYFKAEKHWKSRYAALRPLADGAVQVTDLSNVIEARRAGLRACIARIQAVLRGASSDGESGLSISEFCSQLLDLTASQKKAALPVIDPDFDERRPLYAHRPLAWASAFSTAQEIALVNDPVKNLGYNPAVLLEAVAALEAADKYVTRVEHELQLQEVEYDEGGDPVKLLGVLQAALDDVVRTSPIPQKSSTRGE